MKTFPIADMDADINIENFYVADTDADTTFKKSDEPRRRVSTDLWPERKALLSLQLIAESPILNQRLLLCF